MPNSSLLYGGLEILSVEELNSTLKRLLASMPARLYDTDGEGRKVPEREALEAGGLVLENRCGSNTLAEGTALFAALIERGCTTKGLSRLSG
jgi:hypothetical protein